MSKYKIRFSKTGSICYISHLDLMRLFTRAVKRAGIKLAYSQGFNPHPKLGFAQPLSLGYAGLNELMEIETVEDLQPDDIKERLSALMPPGLDIKTCEYSPAGGKTLAAMTDAAEYIIEIPLSKKTDMSDDEMQWLYMNQDRILTLKKQKKKKEPAEIDIKPMIRRFSVTQVSQANDMQPAMLQTQHGTPIIPDGSRLVINTLLDSGSNSNLSPELVIRTFVERLNLEADRNEMDITRNQIFFK